MSRAAGHLRQVYGYWTHVSTLAPFFSRSTITVNMMWQKSKWTGAFVWVAFALATLTAILVSLLWRWKKEEDPKALASAIISLQNLGQALKNRGVPWTGDVAGLYQLGLISKGVAEADAAPITPLISQPRPFHGYYFVAMETGPSSEEGMDPVPLKGRTRNTDVYAFCAYPAENGRPDQPVYIICPWGRFKKASGGSNPVLSWPKTTRELRQEWAIID